MSAEERWLTRRLGVAGWNPLDPVLLAALALEAPVLLVGPHGTAKSMVVEQVAAALGLPFRHYNASLLNYDDLVGIPLPDEDGTGLRFVSTGGAVWGAGFAFFDEISRCRADLANKLFPIIHERRVAGLDLPVLRHRWAAMNPPAPADPDNAEGAGEVYLGSEPLDPALADRFWFVVSVPGWAQLSGEDRRALVLGAGGGSPDAAAVGAAGTAVAASGATHRAAASGATGGANGSGATDAVPWLAALVDEVRAALPALEAALAGRVADYVVDLVNQLGGGGLPQSPRRARLLARAVVGVHAARAALGGVAPGALGDLDDSAEIAVAAALPQTASEVPPSAATIRAAHRHAWEVSGLAVDDAWRRVLEEPDPLERVALGDRLGVGDAVLSRLVTQALASLPSDARRVGAATAMFLALRDRRDLSPSAFGPLAELAHRTLRPRRVTEHVAPGPALETWREISAHLARRREKNGEADALTRAYLLGGFPELWAAHDWRDALRAFQGDLARFSVCAANGGRR